MANFWKNKHHRSFVRQKLTDVAQFENFRFLIIFRDFTKSRILKISGPLFFSDMHFFEQNRKKRSIVWKWVCLGRFLDGFQNSAINHEKSLVLWDEHIRHRNVHYAVPVGNTFFSRSIYSVAEWKKTLCNSWAKLILYPPLKGFFLIRRGYDL